MSGAARSGNARPGASSDTWSAGPLADRDCPLLVQQEVSINIIKNSLAARIPEGLPKNVGIRRGTANI